MRTKSSQNKNAIREIDIKIAELEAKIQAHRDLSEEFIAMRTKVEQAQHDWWKLNDDKQMLLRTKKLLEGLDESA